MRLPKSIVVTSLALALAAIALPVRAEATRTLRVELSADALPRFAVENLAGAMRVAPANVTTVVATATVHAESHEFAGAVKFEQVAGKTGVPTLRVRYPMDEVGTFLYPGPGRKESPGFLEKMFDGGGTQTEYDGRRVRISRSHGTLLYADVDVQVPKRLADATFRNVVGSLDGKDLDGKIKFNTGSGDITVARVRGEIKTDTGSGDVKASEAGGKFTCDTGSGNCDIEAFRGETIHCDVGSGDVTIRGAVATLVDVDTGSGDVRIVEGDIEEFRADTGSGDVRLENRAGRLARVTTDTGSGDVVLRLGPNASFEALADQGSGDIIMGYKDAQAIVRRKEIVGYRRGDGRIKIDVDTGSGDLTIEPAA